MHKPLTKGDETEVGKIYRRGERGRSHRTGGAGEPQTTPLETEKQGGIVAPSLNGGGIGQG